MKNSGIFIALLALIGSPALFAMTSSVRSVGQGAQAHARWLQGSHKEYNELYRNRNRTPEQEARFKELKEQRTEQRGFLRDAGVRNVNRAL